jgi:hypothetical protein
MIDCHLTECRGAEKNGYGRAHLDPGEEDDDGHRTEALQSAGQPYPVVARSERLVMTIHEQCIRKALLSRINQIYY